VATKTHFAESEHVIIDEEIELDDWANNSSGSYH
jgi:hypothetical protein